MQVFDRELKVSYEIGEDLIQLSQTTNAEATLSFSILDIEKVNGYTTVEFNNIEELQQVINDFRATFKRIK
jgi:UDP-N-acetylglucosamine transferase subunit ALG13